ncbi:MAG: hypothetical protein F4X59_17115 [Holophagales bacterium]|nr:hypothetical protein [Holophagales bacterium]MYC11827.1 hypothetical protein [Holophagales bacterium]
MRARKWLPRLARTLSKVFLAVGFASLGLLLEANVGLENETVLAIVAVVGIVGGLVPWDRWFFPDSDGFQTTKLDVTWLLGERSRFAALVPRMFEVDPVDERFYWSRKLANLGIPTPPLNEPDRWEPFMLQVLAHAEDGNLEGARRILEETEDDAPS